ncbi:metabotropic glutamate receptor-like Protein [Elysia marginata]|uniref:Metabotropic glutamate receptor-like Protein n=1 Tax=Elysia marginata TaxID=1093978 RepID=A0AAV4GD16_9GAST|nr:metabotropic glutamate receptor-like Protein [Elysia marginata]
MPHQKPLTENLFLSPRWIGHRNRLSAFSQAPLMVIFAGNYGIRGMEAFKDRAIEKGICFGAEDNVASTAGDEDFDTVVDNLLKWPNATVVVCFCEGMTVRNLVRATRRKNVEGAFLFIGSDGWGDRVDVVHELESAVTGAISLMLYSPRIPQFAKHYASLKPHGSPNNPWFEEFWEEKFQCSLGKKNPRRLPPCSRKKTHV